MLGRVFGIFFGNLLILLALLAIVFTAGQFLLSMLPESITSPTILDFLFPVLLFLTGIFLQLSVVVKRPFGVILLLSSIGTIVVDLLKSLKGGFGWWLSPLEQVMGKSGLVFLPGVLVFVSLLFLITFSLVNLTE